ncbi:unnamed protein product [Rotaria sp. Silwood2]|nr:unnamed protein product [Rotaria sp. Silwood2]
MLNNTTSILNQYIESVNQSTVTNDSLGAIIFIIIVLCFYSSSFVFLLGMQMQTSAESLDESINPPTKLFVQSFRDLSNNKEILEELVNKQNRDKLWDIYLDYKILEEWKGLSDELKANENWPWAIQKLIIRRYLRRQRHASECGSAP